MNCKYIRLPILMVVALIGAPSDSFADLKSKSELLAEQYQTSRSQGLTRLNGQYIDLYKKELESALQSSRLKEANAIQELIAALEKENKELKKKPDGEKEEFSIIKKTLHFPHESRPDFTVRVKFREEGDATWIGLGNVEALWTYEKGEEPLVYYFGGGKLYRADIHADGKTAIITKKNTAYRVEAEIKRSR